MVAVAEHLDAAVRNIRRHLARLPVLDHVMLADNDERRHFEPGKVVHAHTVRVHHEAEHITPARSLAADAAEQRGCAVTGECCQLYMAIAAQT